MTSSPSPNRDVAAAFGLYSGATGDSDGEEEERHGAEEEGGGGSRL